MEYYVKLFTDTETEITRGTFEHCRELAALVAMERKAKPHPYYWAWHGVGVDVNIYDEKGEGVKKGRPRGA